VSLVGYQARNHPQQTGRRGPRPEVDDRATAPEVFGPLMARFAFTVDVAASAANARRPRFYTVEDDGLSQSWAGERVWCNPPYSDVRPWVAKAWAESAADLIVMLLPANRTEQLWWQRLVEPYRDRPGSRLRVEFLSGRLRFVAPSASGVGPNERPPFGCCLLIWQGSGELTPPPAVLAVQTRLALSSTAR
jgi:phage N-6-adenine-methyltransferase